MANDGDRLVGTSSYIVYNDIEIPITRYSVETERVLVDTTGGDGYDPNSDMICPRYIAVSRIMTLNVSGRFRVSAIPIPIMQDLFEGNLSAKTILGLYEGILWGQGYFQINNFVTDVPVEDIVNYTCVLKGQGPFKPLAPNFNPLPPGQIGLIPT